MLSLVFGISYRKKFADYSYSVATQDLVEYLQNNGIKFEDEIVKNIKDRTEYLFKPIKETNSYLFHYFLFGVSSILMFVVGSTIQLLEIN